MVLWYYPFLASAIHIWHNTNLFNSNSHFPSFIHGQYHLYVTIYTLIQKQLSFSILHSWTVPFISDTKQTFSKSTVIFHPSFMGSTIHMWHNTNLFKSNSHFPSSIHGQYPSYMTQYKLIQINSYFPSFIHGQYHSYMTQYKLIQINSYFPSFIHGQYHSYVTQYKLIQKQQSFSILHSWAIQFICDTIHTYSKATVIFHHSFTPDAKLKLDQWHLSLEITPGNQ